MKKVIFTMILLATVFVTAVFAGGTGESAIQEVQLPASQATINITSEVSGTVFFNRQETSTTVTADQTISMSVAEAPVFYIEVRDQSGMIFPMSGSALLDERPPATKGSPRRGTLIFDVYIEDPSRTVVRPEDFNIQQNRQGGITITGYTGSRSNVIIPETIQGINVTEIADRAFFVRGNWRVVEGFFYRYEREGPQIIKSVSIPNTVTRIGNWAFANQKLLRNVVLPDSLIEIDAEAFNGCGLRSITIPAHVTNIGFGAFRDNELTEVIFSENGRLATIGREAFSGNRITNISFPASLRSIESMAFSLNRIATLEIPSTLESFDGFRNNPISSIVFPWGYNRQIMGFDWENISSITLPSNVNMRDAPTSFTNFWISQNREAGIYTKQGEIWTRQDSPDLLAARARGYIVLWSAVSGTILLDGQETGRNIAAGRRTTINIENASGEYELSVRGSDGIIYRATERARLQGGSSVRLNVIINPANPSNSADFRIELTGDGSGVIIRGYTGRGGNVVIPAHINGLPVVEIGNGLFYKNTTITSVTIPEGITRLGTAGGWFIFTSGVFEGCINLVSVNLPRSLSTIGDKTFLDCTSLNSITIPTGVTEIGFFAFSGSSSLTTVTIPSSVRIIQGNAFSECSRLNTVTIQSRNISISGYAFGGNPNLTTINLEANAAINWNGMVNHFIGSRINSTSQMALRNAGYGGNF